MAHYAFSSRPVGSNQLRKFLLRLTRELEEISMRIPKHNDPVKFDMDTAASLLRSAEKKIVQMHPKYKRTR